MLVYYEVADALLEDISNKFIDYFPRKSDKYLIVTGMEMSLSYKVKAKPDAGLTMLKKLQQYGCESLVVAVTYSTVDNRKIRNTYDNYGGI